MLYTDIIYFFELELFSINSKSVIFEYNDSMVVLYTKHFTSLLRYMIDRENAVKALDLNEVKTEYYKNALNYVEKNGINIYGLLIYGESRDLLEFIDNQNIKTIEIKGVLPSKYIN